MSDLAPPSAIPPGRVPAGARAAGGSAGLVGRSDGLCFDLGQAPAVLLAALERIYQSGAYCAGLDYAALQQALFRPGPPWRADSGQPRLLRFAAGVLPFSPLRLALYKSVKVHLDPGGEQAEYYFEPIYPDHADAHELPAVPGVAGLMADALPRRFASLDFDEFVAALWLRGIRYGIDVRAVRAALAANRAERVVVARALAPLPGRDASIVALAPLLPDQAETGPRDGARSYREVRAGTALLKKIPALPGRTGFALSGAPLPAPPPLELDLAPRAGPGTRVEQRRDGQFLLAERAGALQLGADGVVAVVATIVSHDGVSVRTTGDLRLTRAFVEYGEVQEQRSVDGADLTIHGDVYGKINSRGGSIVLHSNLVGGSASNADGPIQVDGLASNATLLSPRGEVRLARAENCVIAGRRVHIGHASHCLVLAEELVIDTAEGCSLAGRRLDVGSAGPRKQREMQMFVLVPDMADFDERIAALSTKAGAYARGAARLQQQIDALTGAPELNAYLALASRRRKGELVLTPEQEPQFQKMAVAAGPALKTVARLRVEAAALQVQQEQALQDAIGVGQDKLATAGQSRARVRSYTGETLVYRLVQAPGAPHPASAKEIKAALRDAAAAAFVIATEQDGPLDWTFTPDV